MSQAHRTPVGYYIQRRGDGDIVRPERSEAFHWIFDIEKNMEAGFISGYGKIRVLFRI
jgi:hypothetical protein